MNQTAPVVYTVTQITEEIAAVFSSEFSSVAVEGEISGWKIAASGHAYFTLKDERSLLKAVMWRSRLSRLEVQPADGQLVRVYGDLTVYAPRGEYQLDVQRITQAGIGLLQQRFEELKRKLATEGLFDSSRKREPPLRLRKIALITSPTGAAVRDFLRTIKNANLRIEILILPVRVQGVEAPPEIAAALKRVGQLGCELAALVRGGGSLEDLWAFNEEIVARAVAACPVPVISGVGHEVDFTIADFVADIRAATPTAAAQFVIDHVQSLSDRVEDLTERLAALAESALWEYRRDFDSLYQRLLAKSPLGAVPFLRQRLDDLAEGAARILRHGLEVSRSKLKAEEQQLLSRYRFLALGWKGKVNTVAERLVALEPRATLKRGFVLCERAADSAPVRVLRDVPAEGNVRVHLADGNFEATPVR